MYTAGSAFLEALVEAGVSHVFVNWGSDHPSLIEAIAEARAKGVVMPRVITCPNEMAALSAAHGFYQASGVAQAVIVHVECGTQSLGGAVHNAAKGRIPVLIFAGASPFTQEGELPGSRNEFIQWIQDVHDQRGLVRGYMRYDYELRTGRNIRQIVHRALQFANSEPKGPVYLMGAREVMEEEIPQAAVDPTQYRAIEPAALPASGVVSITSVLAAAERPLVVTSYSGRSGAAFSALTEFCRKHGVGVLESVPTYLNFPHTDELYQGNQWNQPVQNEALASADLVLVIDSDVPWIPAVSRPAVGAPIFQIDADPLKEQMPLFHVAATRVFRADAATALAQLVDLPADEARVEERRSHWAALHRARLVRLEALETEPAGEISPEYLVARVREMAGEDILFLNEGISNYHTVFNHLRLAEAGSIFASGGGSLGWNGGAAFGVKLARPDKTVIALTGDGSYMFSAPSSVHWMARQYGAPFLQIIFNNRGWKSPKLSALAVHPAGYASRAESLDMAFDPPPDYAGIAVAAGGALGLTVKEPGELDNALRAALRAVREEGRAAVLDVWVAKL